MRKSYTMENGKKIEYLDIPVTMQINTSDKGVTDWAICANGETKTGNGIESLTAHLARLSKANNTSPDLRLAIYVNNLPAAYHCLNMRASWISCFATSERSPLVACTANGIELRSLDKLTNLPVSKLTSIIAHPVHEFDGSLSSHVELANEYIAQEIEARHGIANIPITMAGGVRKDLRALTIYGSNGRDYKKMIKSLTMTSDEYRLAKEAKRGAYCIVSPKYRDKIIESVSSADIGSAYPWVMCVEKYPMGKGQKVKITSKAHWDSLRKDHCIMTDVCFKNLRKRDDAQAAIAKHDVRLMKGEDIQDDMVISADALIMSIVDVDLETLSYYYTWDSVGFDRTYAYQAGYLPINIINYILTLYAEKERLKGIPYMAAEYARAKAKLNSIYGIMCMSLEYDKINYLRLPQFADRYEEGEYPWETVKADTEDSLKAYNESKQRFTSYLWGIWVTAYQRRNISVGISLLGKDFVYSDTDCLKYVGNHEDTIEKYNNVVHINTVKACKALHIDPARFAPYGRWMGEYQFEETADMIKILGQKTYMTAQNDGEISITVAGLYKGAVRYFADSEKDGKYYANAPREALEKFAAQLTIPAEFTGLSLVYYVDNPEYIVYNKPMDYTIKRRKDRIDLIQYLLTEEGKIW